MNLSLLTTNPSKQLVTERFRRAGAKDIKLVQQLLHRAYQEPKSVGIVFPASTITKEKVSKNIHNRRVYLLTRHVRVIGTVSIRKRSFGYEICHLAVEPDYQHKGVGSRLMNHAENKIKTLGHTYAYLFTSEDHPWLRVFYRRRGYKRLRVREQNNMLLALYRKHL